MDNLVALTKNFKVKEILLSEIKELDEPYWYPDSHPTTQDIINPRSRFVLSNNNMFTG